MKDPSEAERLLADGKRIPLEYIYIATRDKLAILGHWLLGKRSDVSAGQMAKYLFRKPLLAKGKGLAESLENQESFNVIRLRGMDLPIYYPEEYELSTFYINACSVFFPEDWHYYEVQETSIAADDIVLDCGAAEGLFSVSVAGRCKRVYAIEPLPRFVEALERTFKRADNVELLPFALCDEVGKATMVDAGPLSSMGIRREGVSFDVETSTVDELFYKRGIPIDFIKADLEGYELLMLEGAENTIRENSPKIAIATYHKKEHESQIRRYLASANNRYQIKTKGINQFGTAFMLHAWVE